MALSEREEALLQQMEDALYAEDPRFASRIKKHSGSPIRRGRLALAVLGAVAGLGLIIAGASMSQIWLGAVGFAVMVAGIALGVTPGKPRLTSVSDEPTSSPQPRAAAATPGAPRTIKRPSKSTGSNGSFMQRMEERWDKRKRDGW